MFPPRPSLPGAMTIKKISPDGEAGHGHVSALVTSLTCEGLQESSASGALFAAEMVLRARSTISLRVRA